MKRLALLLLFAASAAAQAPLVGTEWRLVGVSTSQARYTPGASEVHRLRFGADGSYNGQADCLKVSGTYTLGPGDRISLTPSASRSTPASCRPSQAAQAMERALPQAETLARPTDGLTLRSPWSEVRWLASSPPRPFVSQQMGRQFVYTCSGLGGPFEIVVQTGWDEAGIELPTDLDPRSDLTAVYAQQVPAPTGARYETAGVAMYVDPVDVALHLRGAEAVLRSGKHTADCVEAPDASDGEPARFPVVFRGTGLTAGWYVSISEQPGGARVYLNVGLTNIEAFDPSPEVNAGRTVYRDEARGVEVTVTDEPCVFGERGGPEGVSVRFRYDGREWAGCGQTH